MWSAVMKAILAAILAILDWLGSPGAEPTGPDGPVLWAPGSEAAAGAFALLRSIDPCALHDAVAAEAITGDHPDQILPGASLAGCQLRLHRDGTPTWTFTISVGVAFPLSEREASTSEEIDGQRLYRRDGTKLPTPACTYTRPMGPAHGISLTAAAPTGDAAAPCPVAKAYLRAARSLTGLVLRLERRTQPRLDLASIDPCAAAPAVLDRLSVPGTAHPQALYECRIQPQSAPNVPAGAPVTISFGFGPDPGELAGSDASYAPVTVEGHRGVVITDGEAQQCVITVAYDTDAAAVQVDHTRWVQTVSVHTTSCAQAKPLADVVISAVNTQ